MDQSKEFFKSANPLVEKQLEVFMEGFTKAITAELEEIKKQAEGINSVIQSGSLAKPK